MLIAVTGANGFVGGYAARRLLDRGHHVIAFGRRPESTLEPDARLTYVRWDITKGAIDARPVDAVVHCAGRVTEWGTADEFTRANVEGTANVLESFAGAGVFVHLSTASVYDLTLPKLSITEEAPFASRFVSEYSRSKIRAEELVGRRRGDAVILRPHIVYGPGESKVLPRLLDVLRRGPVLVPGNGRNRLSLTHVENLTHAIELAIELRGGHQVFNVADETNATVDDLLVSVQSAFGFSRPIHHVPIAAAWLAAYISEELHRRLLRARIPTLTRFLVAQLAFDFTLDISRARAVLGYRPQRSYADAFGEMAPPQVVA